MKEVILDKAVAPDWLRLIVRHRKFGQSGEAMNTVRNEGVTET